MAEGLKEAGSGLSGRAKMALPPDDSLWYARRNGTVRGPFTEEYLARYILLGRIRLNDELSLDRVNWRPTREYPGLFPRELAQPACREDYRQLATARRSVDERTSQRRAALPASARPARAERRVSAERRSADAIGNDPPTSDFPDFPHGLKAGPRQPLRAVMLAMLLMTLALAYFGLSSG
jgi:hypothetical protein